MKNIKSFVIGFSLAALIFSSGTIYAGEQIRKISAYINSEVTIYVDGKSESLSSPVISYNGKNYLALTDAFKLTDSSVSWDNQKKSIIVSTESRNSEMEEELQVVAVEGQRLPDLVYQDDAYLQIMSGVRKYDLPNVFSYSRTANILSFSFEGISETYSVLSTGFSPGSESFMDTNFKTVFVKETIFQELKSRLS